MNILLDIIAGIVVIGLLMLSMRLFLLAIWVASQDPDEWKEQRKKSRIKPEDNSINEQSK